MAEPAPSPAPSEKNDSNAGRKVGAGLVVLVALAFAAWFALSVLPRWWSHRVGNQVDGDLTTGAILGFTYGFFAMLLPLLVLGIVYRFARRSVKGWVIGLLIALLLASPNLLTLGIAVGRGDAAHAADRTLDVEAPYFRGGMVIGAGAALAIALYFSSVLWSRRRSRERDGNGGNRARSTSGP